ncbi:MAG: hypothetical protein R8K46_04260, partial [Mariprofundaceae bacterium]
IGGELDAGLKLARLLYASDSMRTSVMARHGQRLTDTMTDVFMGTHSYDQFLSRVPGRILSWLRLAGRA